MVYLLLLLLYVSVIGDGDIYLLTTAAENETETPKRAEIGLTGWIDCYPKSHLAGHLFCGGVNDAREIEGNTKLQEAFELGEKI